MIVTAYRTMYRSSPICFYSHSTGTPTHDLIIQLICLGHGEKIPPRNGAGARDHSRSQTDHVKLKKKYDSDHYSISRRPCVCPNKLMTTDAQFATCNWTCWTTWRKPWRRWTEKKVWGALQRVRSVLRSWDPANTSISSGCHNPFNSGIPAVATCLRLLAHCLPFQSFKTPTVSATSLFFKVTGLPAPQSFQNSELSSHSWVVVGVCFKVSGCWMSCREGCSV